VSDAKGPKVNILDECDPVTFNSGPPTGPGLGVICKQDFGGDVTFLEFARALTSGGHPEWRFRPSSLTIPFGEQVNVENEGGETHTFTEVPKFGGGFVSAINGPLGLTPLQECADNGQNDVPNPNLVFFNPDDERRVRVVGAGVHLFQCCIHPWMHTVIEVK
jgi:plastocyanin